MKIQRFIGSQSQLPYPSSLDQSIHYWSSFLESDLGNIYQAIPWEELIKALHLKDKTKGPQCIFSPRGKLALMFLKHYAGVSDRRLIDQLNGNIDYQIFCDILIDPRYRIRNFKIVSEIRCEIGKKLNIDKLQMILANAWRGYIENKDSMTCDATCYESYLRFPTDIKLLYETMIWNYKQLVSISHQLGRRVPRTKYMKWFKKYKSYSKSRRPSKKLRRSVTRGLLRLLNKVHQELSEIEGLGELSTPSSYITRRLNTPIIIAQQSKKFYEGINPENRIVSLDKPYIRPIVRGKETKKVEFGAKVNKIQIDGIGFIEHLSFNAFNEGTRLVKSINATQLLMKTETKVVGADAIYATNANRNYVTKKGIKTDFKRKGKPSKHKNHYDQLRLMITKERATRLEGSFGTDKEHFLLNRIKARTEHTEKAWIFFGIHTSNALKIGRRIASSIAQAA